MARETYRPIGQPTREIRVTAIESLVVVVTGSRNARAIRVSVVLPARQAAAGQASPCTQVYSACPLPVAVTVARSGSAGALPFRVAVQAVEPTQDFPQRPAERAGGKRRRPQDGQGEHHGGIRTHDGSPEEVSS